VAALKNRQYIHPYHIMIRLSIGLLLVLIAVPEAAWTFSSPFGTRLVRQSAVHPVKSSSSAFCPRTLATPLFAKKKTKTEADDDWEPNDADLSEFEDIDITNVDDDGIASDEIVVATEDDVVAEDEDDDDEDDDDKIDEGLDVWQEDEEEDIEEEVVGEAGADDGEWDNDGEDEETVPYLGGETDGDDEWEEEEDEEEYPLEDDPEDPNYMAQKKLVQEAIERRTQVAADKDFEPLEYMMNKMTDEEAALLDATSLQQEVEAMVETIEVDEKAIEKLDLLEEMEKAPELMDVDPWDNIGETDILGTGLSDDDLEEMDKSWKDITDVEGTEMWDKVSLKNLEADWDNLSNETLFEMDAALEEIGGSAYNCTRWLLYDLEFNVSNLILASVKHNKEAPILFQHWYPQLLTYERYEHARERNFDFNWEDVQGSDISELERYYAGFGYTEIPKKAPAETGIIGLEDLDEEELKMAAFENWHKEVYNPEWDRKDFDDDTMRDEDNVFSNFYEAPNHPDLPTYEDAQEDLEEWQEEIGDDPEDQEYRDMMGKEFKYTVNKDTEFENEFRGHLIVACGPFDEDLEIAEKITERMTKEYGKQVYVETRVLAYALEEDFVFEVWLESYDIELLHSKKRAAANAKDWSGPVECDDNQIDWLTEQVGFLISDDSRYSYRMDTDLPV
jgi:hypothetical protein